MGSPFDNKKSGTATKTKAAAKDEGFATATDDGDVDTTKKSASQDPFAMPPSQAEIQISDLVGTLVICKPTEVIDSMLTSASPEPVKNVIRADITAVDGDYAGQTFEDVLVFQTALKRALLKVLNDETHTRMLGRIEMGQKKPGKNAPYLFSKPDEDDIAAAQAL